MDTFEVAKFEELVSKVHAIFCQFPLAKECKLAILGLSEIDDLNDAMEELVETFDSTDACDFALRVVQAKWRPFQKEINAFGRSPIQITLDLTEKTIDLLALLYYNVKSFRGQIRLEAGFFRLSPSLKLALICLSHKNAELKRDGFHGFETCLDIRKRLSNPRLKEALDDFQLCGSFTTLYLCSYVFEYNGYTGNHATEEGEVSNEDVDRVLHIIQQGSGVESLRCTAGGIPTRFTEGLVEVLKQGRMRKLFLEYVTFKNVTESIQHLCAGLEAWKKENRQICNDSSGLAHFRMREIARSSVWGHENICRLIKALTGISTLQHLDLYTYLSGEIGNSVVVALNDLFLHPQCQLVAFSLCGKGIETDETNDDSDTHFMTLCNDIARCKTMRTLTLQCDPLPLTRISTLLTSPGCRIEGFHLLTDDNDMVAIAKSFESANPHHSPPSRLRDISLNQNSTRAAVVAKRFRKDLQSTLGLFRDKLPYLRSFSPCDYSYYRDDLPYDNKTPDHIIANADVIAEIGLWQERNQCGRALLLKPVAPTVPVGLWPKVFEVAAKKTSILKQTGPPVDGVYYLVHGLVAANLLGGDLSSGKAEASSTEAIRSGRLNEGDVSSRSKRQRTS